MRCSRQSLKECAANIKFHGMDRMIFKPQQEEWYHASGFISAGDRNYIKTTWIEGAAADNLADCGQDQQTVRAVCGRGKGHEPFYGGQNAGIAGAVHGSRRSAGFLCDRGRFSQ